MKYLKKLTLLMALVGILVLVVACSNEGNEEVNANDGAKNNNSDEEVSIGALNPLTGAGDSYGSDMLKTIQIAVDQVNEAGGVVDGKMLKVHSEDSESSPSDAVPAAQKLIRTNNVEAILGTWASAVTLAVAPEAIDNEVVHISTSGAPEITDLDDNNFVFRTHPSNIDNGRAYAAWALEEGYQTASTLAANDPSAQGIVNNFVKYFEEGGGKVLESVNFEDDKTTYRDELNKVLKPDPELVVLGSYEPVATIMLTEAFQLDAQATFLGAGFAINDSLIGNVGEEALENVVAIDPIPDEDSPAFEEAAELFAEESDANLFNNTYAVQTFDQVHLIALAMEKAQSTKAADWRDALQEISGAPGEKVYSFEEGKKLLEEGEDIDYQGASGPIDFDENGDITAIFGAFKVKDGHMQIDKPFDIK